MLTSLLVVSLGISIQPGYSSIKGHWNQEPQKPRRDDNVALKALRATATTRPVTGLPPSAGKSSICRTRLFLLLLLLPAPWPKAGRLGVVTLTTFRPSFRAPFFPPPLRPTTIAWECSLTHIWGRAAAHDCP